MFKCHKTHNAQRTRTEDGVQESVRIGQQYKTGFRVEESMNTNINDFDICLYIYSLAALGLKFRM